MAAYLIANIDITDAQNYKTYIQMVPASIEKFGGKYLVRGGKFENLEGDWQPKRLVIIEFPSFEQAKLWYESEDYRDAKDIRIRSSLSELTLVEGY
jgi:uncharacterized protein (DUF1330 family)